MIQRYISCKTLFWLAFAALFLCPGSLFAQMPANLDFGNADLSNWEIWIGHSIDGDDTTGPRFYDSSISAPIGGAAPGPGTAFKSRHAVTSGSDTDYYSGMPIVCPAGGLYSLRLGDDNQYAYADRMRYYIHVPANSPSYNIQYQYAMVLQSEPHQPKQQGSLKVVAYDSATGELIPNANNVYVGTWDYSGFKPAWHTDSPQPNGPVEWLPWTPSTINLSDMAGKTVILEFTVVDCAFTGHFTYAYLDVTSVADTLQPTVVEYNPAQGYVTFQGPPGYKTYHWFNQDFSSELNSSADTSRTLTLQIPELNKYYNLVITPQAPIGVPDTIRTQILRSNVGVSSKVLTAVRIYPNPVATVLHLSAPVPFDGSLQMFNAAGACIYRREVSGKTEIQIPTANLAAGTYNLILDDKRGGTETRKVVVER